MNSLAIAIKSDIRAVELTWRNTKGNYDPSHYTVQLFANNTLIGSTVISASSRLVAEFATPFTFSGTVNVYAKITVTSKCNQESDGVFTDTFTITSTSDGVFTDNFMITSTSDGVFTDTFSAS